MGTNGSNLLQIECPRCKQRFSKEMPVPVIQNESNYSSAIATHERAVICPNGKCGQAFIFFIKATRIVWDVQPITENDRRQIEGSSIIQLLGATLKP